jgi:hypothetical protein
MRASYRPPEIIRQHDHKILRFRWPAQLISSCFPQVGSVKGQPPRRVEGFANVPRAVDVAQLDARSSSVWSSDGAPGPLLAWKQPILLRRR